MHVYNEAPVRSLSEAVDAIRQALDIRDPLVRRAAFAEAVRQLERAVVSVKSIDATL